MRRRNVACLGRSVVGEPTQTRRGRPAHCTHTYAYKYTHTHTHFVVSCKSTARL